MAGLRSRTSHPFGGPWEVTRSNTRLFSCWMHDRPPVPAKFTEFSMGRYLLSSLAAVRRWATNCSLDPATPLRPESC